MEFQAVNDDYYYYFLKNLPPSPPHLSLFFKTLLRCHRRCYLGNLRALSHNGNEKVEKKHTSK